MCTSKKLLVALYVKMCLQYNHNNKSNNNNNNNNNN